AAAQLSLLVLGEAGILVTLAVLLGAVSGLVSGLWLNAVVFAVPAVVPTGKLLGCLGALWVAALLTMWASTRRAWSAPPLAVLRCE
ncbi:MAG: hypothetical protein N3B15_02140, partial [Planctomycetota bacterium]|nr:hypothetical protein [Planctomycetota bacterium]